MMHTPERAAGLACPQKLARPVRGGEMPDVTCEGNKCMAWRFGHLLTADPAAASPSGYGYCGLAGATRHAIVGDGGRVSEAISL